ncbi:hypothetical protein [Mycobacterium sp. 1245805.9]|uniref:hypothetical protein n=1 Tax=Mycobacterium sp. 1245805.9 TaxID=1856862 RepID=UPI0007FE527A|nr:hypothetical protein [Mycobacterium sp. 1245805.9]OBI93920.1 hypothetical protein A9X00_13665 [Mycobacterium sp. 1245805.9]
MTLREHDELTSQDPGDHDEAATAPTVAPRDAGPRTKGTIALLAAVACVVLGAKLITISALGSPVPLSDQWAGEAGILYSRYLRGVLSVADLFAPHNEHRIFVFRIFALAHLELAGEWNTRFEMIFGAIVETAAITWLASVLTPVVAPQRRMLLACFVAFVGALPVYENTLWGFQDQVYLALFFGIGGLVALAAARPFSVRWLCGLTFAVLSYFSFATGVATILAAGALVALQIAANARRRCRREFAGLVVMASVALAMILWAVSVAKPMSSPWTFIEGLFGFAALVGAALVPTTWFCYRTVARRPGISDRAWVVVGIAAWLGIQFVLFAYGRGVHIAIRYTDVMVLAYAVGLMSVLALADSARGMRFGRHAARGVVAWVFTVVTVVAAIGYYGSVLGAIDWSKAARQEMIKVQAYLATGNVDDLKSKSSAGHGIELSYPNPTHLATVLKDPDVRAILPPEIRPADADNPGARNRMWLKGSLAGATATAVRLILSIGPVLLALGLGVFFAAGTRRSLARPKGDAIAQP